MEKIRLSKLFQKTLIITLTVLSTLITIIFLITSDTFYEGIQKQYKSKGLAIAESIADASIDMILNRDAATIQSKINDYETIENVAYIIVRNDKGTVISHTLVPIIPKNLINFHQTLLTNSEKKHIHNITLSDGSTALDITVPILSGKLGHVHVGMETSSITRLIWGTLGKILLVVLLLLIITSVLLYYTMSKISQPILQLDAYATALGQHDFKDELPIQREIQILSETQKDEIGKLAKTMSTLENQIIQYIQDLKTSISETEKIQTELSIAKKIQLSMLPKKSIVKEFSQLNLDCLMLPAKEVGGDFYNFFMKDENTLVFTIGDVSGKGPAAALFMAVTTTLLKSIAQQYQTPDDIIRETNKQLCLQNENSLFVTVFLGILDIRTGALSYCNAGHPQPICHHHNGEISLLPLTKGMALGIDDSCFFQMSKTTLSPKDQLLLYTDGITEAQNKDDLLFEEDRLINCYKASLQKKESCCQLILDDVQSFAEDMDQADDITMLNIQWLGSNISLKGMCKLHFTNTISEITKLHHVIEQFGTVNEVSEKTQMNINLILEELLSNIIYYGYEDHNEHLIYLYLKYENNVLTAIIEDDGIPFNPLEAPEVDVDQSLEQKSVGGLGIHFVRKLSSALKYKRVEKTNKLMIKLKD
ncbi:hypothetical protein DID77_01150 [Candidatus Marinamargulisbacteria bacterium SCGC AG-439-L15]|nr:hypothetical protein DID77_01150 [Candidatus Marinamargulisbacteria bacterium SCGC AG-439-L15]